MPTRKIRVGAVGWIDPAGPWPIRAGKTGGDEANQMLAGGAWDNKSGIVKTYMGLMATSNSAPPKTLDFPAYRKGQDFRGMVLADLIFDDAAPTAATAPNVKYAGTIADSMIVDPGSTPPVDASKVAAMGRIPSWWGDKGKHIADRTWYPAEASSLSQICLASRHPNSVLSGVGQGEAIIANGLLRFRAGTHTDEVGMTDANSQYHVPWVWVEFLLTSSGPGQIRLRGASSQFPTVAWYLDDQQVGAPHPQSTDASFTFKKPSNDIDVSMARIWPVLQAGPPKSMKEPPASSDDAFKGKTQPVTSLPYTAPGAPYLDERGAAAPVATPASAGGRR